MITSIIIAASAIAQSNTICWKVILGLSAVGQAVLQLAIPEAGF